MQTRQINEGDTGRTLVRVKATAYDECYPEGTAFKVVGAGRPDEPMRVEMPDGVRLTIHPGEVEWDA